MACTGSPISAAIPASTSSASRQPSQVTSAAVSGTNTTLASPPKTVSTSTARGRCRSNQAAVTANTGSYRVVAIARPPIAKTQKNIGTESTVDHSASMTTVATVPVVITPRAPWACSTRPTGIASSPEMITPVAYAALSSAVDQPSSSRMGTTSTENA